MCFPESEQFSKTVDEWLSAGKVGWGTGTGNCRQGAPHAENANEADSVLELLRASVPDSSNQELS